MDASAIASTVQEPSNRSTHLGHHDNTGVTTTTVLQDSRIGRAVNRAITSADNIDSESFGFISDPIYNRIAKSRGA